MYLNNSYVLLGKLIGMLLYCWSSQDNWEKKVESQKIEYSEKITTTNLKPWSLF